MIEKRFVQWYASDAGVDLDVAEREIVLTYVLSVLSDEGLLSHLAFKGGTAIRKLYLGATGRFSMDLDFTRVSGVEPDTLVLDLATTLHDRTFHGITFAIADSDYWATVDSCGADITYQHEWMASGRFSIQISCRSMPLLPLILAPLLDERYFDWLELEPPQIPALDLCEVIGEKIRAATHRRHVRDLYDLYQLASKPYDRAMVRRIAVLKTWESKYGFRPAAFLGALPEGEYDWSDLRRLVRPDRLPSPHQIVARVEAAYAFLKDLTSEEAALADDPHGRQIELHDVLAAQLRSVMR
jgi:predicted nucleotidyltransferase component of viral defense system